AHVNYFAWQTGITVTSVAAASLAPNHSYRLWLQAADADGGGPWTAVNFSTLAELAAPIGTTPAASAAVGSPPTITWQAVAGALSYNLRIDDLTAEISYFVWQAGLTGTSFAATTLSPNHSYRLWLEAVDADGGGPWTAVNFTVTG